MIAAIACFTTAPNSYESAIARAIGLGGNTDTLAAMTGALVGAHLGIEAIPPHVLAHLEEQDKGRSYIENLARQLHGRYQRV